LLWVAAVVAATTEVVAVAQAAFLQVHLRLQKEQHTQSQSAQVVLQVQG
jgi:hypothetical protein